MEFFFSEVNNSPFLFITKQKVHFLKKKLKAIHGKDKNCIMPLICGFKKKIHRNRSDFWLPQVEGGEQGNWVKMVKW